MKIILLSMVLTAFFVGCNSKTKQMSNQEVEDDYKKSTKSFDIDLNAGKSASGRKF